jgi:hypothetical protein
MCEYILQTRELLDLEFGASDFNVAVFSQLRVRVMVDETRSIGKGALSLAHMYISFTSG